MATREDLNEDLNVGLTEVQRTLEHYNLGHWNLYLLVRKPGCPDSYITLGHPRDTSDFQDRLVAFHKERCAHER